MSKECYKTYVGKPCKDFKKETDLNSQSKCIGCIDYVDITTMHQRRLSELFSKKEIIMERPKK